MANHSSAKKRIRQNEKRKLQNKSTLSALRKGLKKFESITQKKEATDSFPKIQSSLFKAVAKGLINKRTAARKISHFSAKIK